MATLGEVAKPMTQVTVKTMPSEAEQEQLETALRKEFNAGIVNLVALYGLAEKLGINDLCNKVTNALHDAHHE
jgi:hypothetical protein